MLPDGERNGGIHRIEDLGVDIRDFAIDPGQDLLVLLESEHIIDELSWSRIYFRTMSGNKVHPRAARAKVAYTSPDFHGSEMQIASDVLSLTCSTSLVIWNWHTGIQETTLRMDDTMTDFDFITPRSFLITVRKHTGNVALNLYTFVSPSDGPTPTHIATLEISSLAPPLLSPFSTSHLSHPHINGGLPNGHANGNGAPNANGTAEAGAGRQTGGGLTWRSSITSHTGPYETMLPVEEGGSLFGVGREEAVHVIRLSFGVDPPTPPGGGGGHGHGPGQQGGGGGGGGIGIQGQAQVLPNGMGQIQIAAPGGDIQEFNAALAAVLAAVQQAQGLGQGQGGNVVEQVIGPQLVMGPPQPVLGGGGGGGGGAGVGYHVSFDIIIKNRTFMRIIREIEEERANSSLSPPPLSSSSSSSFYNLHAPLLSRTATPIRISTPNLSGTATPTTPGTPGHGHSHSSRSGGIRWDEHQTKIPAKILKWHEWAPRNTRIVNRGNQHHWLRYFLPSSSSS
ncbi:hypothetical protein SISSUDRAFT_567416 [Sistotremastrum suecicum HHB10207 ss-3]|uniref:Uncharacterized protein n=1 Tax=Sistotremastrum suecicum HHB10207 ss-3 TaxID=1314776 RepID=A0A165XIV1_9AGAM|nr:hypothetical protein SISSUDRAFT_567416 [Sistotremastrum suecicum HHB10207 ss-3]